MSNTITLNSKTRIQSIDILRGIVIVVMGLDHARDFISITKFLPEDVTQTTPIWFFTRWITHFCAPVFVFLAGTSAWLFGQKVKDKNKLAKFLFTRGIWLVLIELIVVNFLWKFGYSFFFIQVIWAIGCSMIFLSVLIYLPMPYILGVGLVMVGGHNLLDGIKAADLGSFSALWKILHESAWVPFGKGGFGIYVVYPLIPWLGVIALGYAFATFITREEKERHKSFYLIGGATVIIFLVLRSINIYGDPAVWVTQERGGVYTFLSFFNLTKYPPSLLFLCMTLGPAILFLPFLEKINSKIGNILLVFGRVPFFFYLSHLLAFHLIAILYFGIQYDIWDSILFASQKTWPQSYAPNLLHTYIVWILVTFGLYFVCKWFAGVKKRRSEWWLKYL